MNHPRQISRIPFLRRQLGLQEFDTLLEEFPFPGLLVDIQNKRITLANTKAVELTLYTRAELIGLDISSLFTNSEVLDFRGEDGQESQEILLTIKKRNNSLEEVFVTITNLSSEHKWFFVSLEPTSTFERRESERIRQSKIMENMSVISKALHEDKLETALTQVLKATQSITGATSLSIYLHNTNDNGHKLEMSRFIHFGPVDIHPEKLPIKDLANLSRPTIWKTGVRTSSNLHRLAHSKKYDILFTAPLGQPNALIGLISLGCKEELVSDEESILSHLSILADTITAIVSQHMRATNLVDDLGGQLLVNSIYKIAEDHIRDSIIILNPDLTVLRVNHAAERIFGYTNSEIQGQPVEQILIGIENLLPVITSVIGDDPSKSKAEVRLYRRNGEGFLANVILIPAFIQNELKGVIVTIQDMSEREQIQSQTRDLEQRALLGEVMAVFAHEVRNPINNISTGLQLMALNLPENDPNQETIHRLDNDCSRLAELMKSVLSFSKPIEFEMEPVDLPGLIRRLLDRFKPRIERANIQHKIKITNTPSPVLGNQRALEQAFTNLINNSIQVMEAGGTLAIKISEEKSPEDRNFIEVSVADSGPGIPKENLDRIFQPFFTTKPHGTGLGLAITKRIITAHKGIIRPESFPGGTVFTVRLPSYNQNPS